MNGLYQSPTAQAFYEAMRASYQGSTGFDPQDASDVGIRMQALAWELHKLGAQMERICADAFPQTAAGRALELHARARGLDRTPAACAAGLLRFVRATPGGQVEIPAGTLCTNRAGDLRFVTTQAGAIAPGETAAELPAAAQTPGPEGNVARGAVCALIAGVPGVAAVTNPTPFSGGRPGEDDTALRARLLAEMACPPDAANAAYYRNIALGDAGVRSVGLLPRLRGPGTLDVVVACRPDRDADEVVPRLQAAVEEAREVGTDVLVRAARPLEVAVAANILPAPGRDAGAVTQSCAAALGDYLDRLEVGAPLLRNRLTGILLGIDGVENFRLLVPDTDILPAGDQCVVPGEITVGRVAAL